MLIRTKVDPRLIRKHLPEPIEKLDAAKLAANRARAEAIVKRARANASRNRAPKVAAAIQRVTAKRKAVQARLRKVLDARTLRTPDQVIQSFVKRLAVDKPGGAIAAPASLLIRSRRSDVEVQLSKLLGGLDLKTAGITVRKLDIRVATPVFSVRFPIAHRAVRNELRNLAWALRRTGAFDSVAIHGLRAMLFAPPEPAAATRAERNFAWHHELTRTSRAHDLQPGGARGKRLGEGIVIAHPDTGWAEHGQYNERRIDKARSHNVVSGETGGSAAKHSVRNGDTSLPNLSHGTATASLMVGGAGDDGEELSTTRPDSALEFATGLDGKRNHLDSGDNPRDRKGHLTGVAPKATVLPIKLVSDTAFEEIPDRGLQGIGVVRLFDEDLVRAVRYAIDESAHVISLSVGGLMHDEVREVLDEAIRDHDIIVVAAAGQTYAANALSAVSQAASATGLVADDSVVLPAAYANVIAVAGCAPNGAPWSESHRGPNVDISAPADAIWVADFAPHDDKLSAGATRDPLLECASGTSFATAIMAGTAALWLAHWGRDALVERYRTNADPAVPLAWVFRHQLQKTSNAAHANDWDDGLYGPGVVNVEALLKEPLPDPKDVEAPPARVENLVTVVSGPAGAAFQAAEDFFLEFMDFLGGLPDAAGKAVAAGLVAAQRAADEGMNALAEAWAAAEVQASVLVGQAQQEAARARDDIEKLIDDTAQAGEELIEETAEQAEDALDAVAEGAEELVDAAGEAAEDFVNWLGW